MAFSTGFDFREQLMGAPWEVAQGYLVEQFDRLYAAINAAPNLTGVVTSTGGIFERGRSAAMGSTIQVPFNATDYTTESAVVWTVTGANMVAFSYMVIGSRMWVDINLTGTALSSATTNTLLIKIPGGYTATGYAGNGCALKDNGMQVRGMLNIAPENTGGSSTHIRVTKFDLSLFLGATDERVNGQINFEIAVS